MTYRPFIIYDSETTQTDVEERPIEEPKICMHCNKTGLQTLLVVVETGGIHDDFGGIALYCCPLCSSTTIHFLDPWNDQGILHYSPSETIPRSRENLKGISNDLQLEFPDFFEIYSQSEKAEEEELDQIAGMGYRKALEFLVTDYLLNYLGDAVNEEWLKNPSTRLGDKILKIPNERMQTLAKATSFLGNDESHYTRRHPEHDIDSMKAFIRVLLSEIQNEIDYKHAEDLINKPKS